MPWKLERCLLGRGVSATKRFTRASAVDVKATPSFKLYSERPSSSLRRRDRDTGPLGAGAAGSLESLSFIVVHGGVCVEVGAMGSGEEPRGPFRQVQRQRLLEGAHLEALEVVVGGEDVDVHEVLLGEAQEAVEDGGDVVVGGRAQRHDAAVDAPQRLGDEEVEVWREWEAATEVLPETHGATGERALVAEAPGGGVEEAPHDMLRGSSRG
jgi:hypothetical protein